MIESSWKDPHTQSKMGVQEDNDTEPNAMHTEGPLPFKVKEGVASHGFGIDFRVAKKKCPTRRVVVWKRKVVF